MIGLGTDVNIVIVCAYHAEAQTLIDTLKLKRLNAVHPFAVFVNDSIALIESGQGALNIASAVGYIAGLIARSDIAWLNLGFAGHASFDLGSLLIAHRIIDDSTGDCHYPLLGVIKNIPSATLRSYADVNLDYHGNDVYDMEGFGFFSSAAKFSSIERIHCLKIISDNAKNPASHLNDMASRKSLIALIEQQREAIIAAVDSLSKETEKQRIIHQPAPALTDLLSKYHFTENQKFQLQQLLRQWQQLSPQSVNDLLSNNEFKNSRQLLNFLNQAYVNHCRQQFLQT